MKWFYSVLKKSSRRWGKCMITSSVPRSGAVSKSGMHSSTRKTLSVLSGMGNSILMQRTETKITSLAILTGRPFRAGAFDFSVIAVHVVWGDTVGSRKAEVKALADVYRYVQEANGTEDDVLLVGDFNRNPTDMDAYSRILSIPSMTRLFDFPQKSHIKDSSLYDNIFFQRDAVTEYLGRSGIDKFDETDFGNDDKAANLAVSDHRPVWAVFNIEIDDDGSDEGGSASVLMQTSDSTESQPLEDVTVYVTRTGKKYHLGSCSSLRRSKIEISLTEAKQQYGACSRCNPPR